MLAHATAFHDGDAQVNERVVIISWTRCLSPRITSLIRASGLANSYRPMCEERCDCKTSISRCLEMNWNAFVLRRIYVLECFANRASASETYYIH